MVPAVRNTPTLPRLNAKLQQSELFVFKHLNQQLNDLMKFFAKRPMGGRERWSRQGHLLRWSRSH